MVSRTGSATVMAGARSWRGARVARPVPAYLFAVALLHGCTGGAGLLRGPVETVVLHRGSYLQVACHFECDHLGIDALHTAEEAWGWVASLLGVDPAPPEGTRATLHLYGSVADYAFVEARLGGGQFREMGGFSSRSQRTAHVLVPSDLPRDYVELSGLPLHYRRSVAHEAAHLAAYDLALGAVWPPWLAEGVAGWVERQTVLGSSERLAGQEANPWAATHLWRAQRLMASDELPSVSDLLTGAPLFLSLPNAYAVWTEAFDFLISGPFASQMEELVREAAASPIPEERSWPVVGEMASRVFGEEGLAAADEAFRAHLGTRQPGWIELYRSLEDAPEGRGAWLQHAVTDLARGAFAWRAGEVGPRQGFRVLASVRPLVRGPWEIRFILARAAGSPLLVSVGSDGRVVLAEFDPERPEAMAELDSRALVTPPGASGTFRISVLSIRGGLGVQLEGEAEDVLFPMPGFNPDGLWGVGVAPGTTVLWEELGLAPL